MANSPETTPRQPRPSTGDIGPVAPAVARVSRPPVGTDAVAAAPPGSAVACESPRFRYQFTCAMSRDHPVPAERGAAAGVCIDRQGFGPL